MTATTSTPADSTDATPLLAPSPSPACEEGRGVCPRQTRWYPYVPFVCGLFCLVADLGGSLTDTPELRLLELAVCRDYYRVHDPGVIGPPPGRTIDEKLCKLEIIQSDLAYLRAWNDTFATIPGKVYISSLIVILPPSLSTILHRVKYFQRSSLIDFLLHRSHPYNSLRLCGRHVWEKACDVLGLNWTSASIPVDAPGLLVLQIVVRESILISMRKAIFTKSSRRNLSGLVLHSCA